MVDKYKVLQNVFGYSTFREGQEPLIDAILSGRDAFGVMPTGGGKSICYQLPALMLPGITLVVSPLISLMKDQVMALDALGIPAGYINSSQTPDESREVFAGMLCGEYKLIYVAPERLTLDGFVSAARSVDVSLIAVDEAHCISQWGQDFRPSYLRIADFVSRLPRRPTVAAFTATATAQVRQDVIRQLSLRDPALTVTGFDRPNLYFDVLRPENRLTELRRLLTKRRDKTGIVYCQTRKQVEQVCEFLQSEDFNATRYHAGLEDLERRRNQEDFIYDRSTVMVATNAFGMGIDKSNVGYVIHYGMPKSLEAYYQEAGRAGRDGERADCILLYSPKDLVTARYLISHSDNPELSDSDRRAVQEADFQRLATMNEYCNTKGCLRSFILDYFGQSHGDHCGSCGNCKASYSSRDITTQAQMILSCVYRSYQKLGYSLGMTVLVKVMAGGRDKRILELGLDSLSTYGLMKGTPLAEIRRLFDELEAQGYLHVDQNHGGALLTAKARGVLFNGERVTALTRMEPERPVRKGKKVKASPAPAPEAPDTEYTDPDAALMEALKLTRLSFARAESVPLYVIFSNATLAEMARLKPKTIDEFLQVPGVGTVKAQRFGEEFLRVIRENS